ncbi:MAG TPA: protein kinase [Acidobacteriaceae bacterium]|nr:protein kinase [Acidobacteriaceae bacterium]
MSIRSRLGRYEVVARIGAGGMGEVYRASDSKLGRDVAIKVLPEAFTHNVERMARFEREAKLLAALNHPNIAAIYGVEDAGTADALVMELAEGPTLADRIRQGRIAVEEALAIARQIADALEYAHEHGVVHRDLKPANIKITPDDSVKILDFGLATAVLGEADPVDSGDSPTISQMGTGSGMLLGTAAYMSPEQARGKRVDRRADIWAFGCVLYEMLTARPAFDGEATAEILAAVLRNDPDWSQLPSSTPTHVRVLLQRCLQKDAKQRLRDIGDARISLEEVLSGAAPTVMGQPTFHSRARRALPWGLLAITVMIAAWFALEMFERSSPATRVYVSELSPPATANYAFVAYSGGPPALAPDGSRVAFCASGAGGGHRLWIRPLGTGTAQPLEGTEGASFPFWSPDGSALGFFAHGKLNRIDASGGPPMAIADAPSGRGGSWARDGTILFAPELRGAVFRVSATGGMPEPVTKINTSLKQIEHYWPQLLPDGKHFLFLALSSDQRLSGIYAASLDGGEPKRILSSDTSAMYAAPGYLLFIREGVLMAQRFDAKRLQLMGDAYPLEQNAVEDKTVNHGIFALSDSGVLVYQSGTVAGGTSQLVWFDRRGKRLELTGSPGEYATVAISPDGKRLAVGSLRPSGVWVFDISRGTGTRLTLDSTNNGQPAWSPDGKRIAFFSDRSGQTHIYDRASDGTGTTASLVVDDAAEEYPAWSPDGRYLVFERAPAGQGSRFDIWAMPLFGSRKVFPLVQTGLEKSWPSISPNGKWLAYVSAVTGREEVYVVPFLQGSGQWLVSTGGGTRPRWRRDGRELFYLAPDNKIMSAEIREEGSGIAVGKVEALLQAVPALTTGWLYDVSPDGRKFVVVSQAAEASGERLTMVVNWPALLKRQ